MNIGLVEPFVQYVIGVLVIVGLGWIVERWQMVLSNSRVEQDPGNSNGHLAPRRIWTLVIGVIAGFTCAFILKYGVHIDTGSTVLFWIMILLATVGGGILVYFIGPWLESRKIPIGLEFLLVFGVGFVGAILGCIIIPLIVVILFLAPELIEDLKKEI